MNPVVRRLLEAKIDAEAEARKKELEMLMLLSEEKNYEHNDLQKELFELLKIKRYVDIQMARWSVKQIDEQLKSATQ
jgi:hypothetical protein